MFISTQFSIFHKSFFNFLFCKISKCFIFVIFIKKKFPWKKLCKLDLHIASYFPEVGKQIPLFFPKIHNFDHFYSSIYAIEFWNFHKNFYCTIEKKKFDLHTSGKYIKTIYMQIEIPTILTSSSKFHYFFLKYIILIISTQVHAIEFWNFHKSFYCTIEKKKFDLHTSGKYIKTIYTQIEIPTILTSSSKFHYFFLKYIILIISTQVYMPLNFGTSTKAFIAQLKKKV